VVNLLHCNMLWLRGRSASCSDGAHIPTTTQVRKSLLPLLMDCELAEADFAAAGELCHPKVIEEHD
jgi:hypothetical protein